MTWNIFKDDILPPQSPRAKELWSTTDPFVVISGGRNKGKSFGILQREFTTCLHFSGIQAAIVRPTQKSMKSTIIPQLNEMLLRYPLSDKRNPWTYNKSEMRIYFNNGSELGFFGMDGDKFLGGTYHFVFYSQVEQEKKPDEISHVLAGMGGYRAGERLLDKNEKPYRIFICDANPGPKTHWLKQWEEEGRAKFINFKHQDHPLLFDWKKQIWTPKGIITREDLHNDYPAGHIREQWVEGEWLSDFGLVYDMAPNTYLIDQLPKDFKNWKRYRSIDFGVHRFICLWIAKNPNAEEYIIYKEYRRHGQTDEIHAKDVLELSKEEKIEFTVGDHDRKGWDVFKKHGIHCKPWKKGPDSVPRGVNLTRTVLSSGELSIWSGYQAVSSPDPRVPLDKWFIENYKPKNLREEMLVYRYKPEEKWTGSETDHEPWKEGNEDACDAMRGFAEEVFSQKREKLIYSNKIPKLKPGWHK